MFAARKEKLESAMRELGHDGVVVVPGPNLHYLTGLRFHLSERPTMAIFRTKGKPLLVVPFLEVGKAEQAPYPVEVFGWTDAEGPPPTFQKALNRLGPGVQLAVEGRRCRFLELTLLGDMALFNGDELFDGLRMVKDAAELEAMQRAADMAQEAFRATLPHIRPGRTEKEVAAELTTRLLKAGSEPELPFFPLVAAGPNGADPHLFPTDRVLRAGDLVVIDWGATHEGYMSDITRTVVLGGADPDPELVKAHDLVRQAARAGREAAGPGATGQEVDRAARRVIERAGYGKRFIHRTGHGLGLEGHEAPYMNEGELLPLEVGMTFTVEPGIYLPGQGGIRIEDDMVITQEGARSLTDLSRELLVLDR